MTRDEEKMLDECLDTETGLTDWEIGFIEALDRDWRGRPLSEKQHDALERTVNKVLS